MKKSRSAIIFLVSVFLASLFASLPKTEAKSFKVSDADSLRAAVNEANASRGPDNIFLAPGTYMIGGSGALLITDDLTLKGGGAEVTVIDANRMHRVFEIDGAIKVTMRGLTVTNGMDQGGAGIYNRGAELTLRECTVSGNYGTSGHWSGAGLLNAGGQVVVQDCLFQNNHAGLGGAILNQGNMDLRNCRLQYNRVEADGGAIMNDSSGAMVISTCFIIGNSGFGNRGGGIYNSGTMKVSRSTISDNYDIYGGGLYNGGDMEIQGCIIDQNEASVGAGLYNEGGAAAVKNSYIRQNEAHGIGGGVYNDQGGMLTVVNGTITENIAHYGGGGIYNEGEIVLKNTLLEGNVPDDCEGC